MLTVRRPCSRPPSVILVMLGISTMKMHRDKWQTFLSGIGWKFTPLADSAAGD